MLSPRWWPPRPPETVSAAAPPPDGRSTSGVPGVFRSVPVPSAEVLQAPPLTRRQTVPSPTSLAAAAMSLATAGRAGSVEPDTFSSAPQPSVLIKTHTSVVFVRTFARCSTLIDGEALCRAGLTASRDGLRVIFGFTAVSARCLADASTRIGFVAGCVVDLGWLPRRTSARTAVLILPGRLSVRLLTVTSSARLGRVAVLMATQVGGDLHHRCEYRSGASTAQPPGRRPCLGPAHQWCRRLPRALLSSIRS